MPGTAAIRNVSRSPTPLTAIGEIAPSSSGRAEIVAFLTRKWRRELDYRLIKELWAFAGDRIAVRFAYECHDDSRQLVPRLRQRELGVRRNGLMRRRIASINDLPIGEADRLSLGPLGPPPGDHPGLSELGL